MSQKELNLQKKEIETLIEEYEVYARKKGWRLNPSPRITYNIVRLLLLNEKQKGIRYCPCKPHLEGKTDTSKKGGRYISECPCAAATDEIAKNMKCCCSLFLI